MSARGAEALARCLKIRLLALPAALWLGGCDLAPRYQVPTAPLPAHFKEGGSDLGKWQQAEPSDHLQRGIWWTAFKDSTLDGLEPQVDDANQTLAAAFANYQQARTQVQQAEAGLFPTLEQDSQLTANRQSDHRTYRSLPSTEPSHYGDNRLTIQSSYEVDLWGRVHDQIQSAAAQTQSQVALLESVRLSLHAQLARNYLALRGYDQQLKLLADTAKAYQDALTLTQNRLAGKIASPMDVDRAQSQLETAKALSDDVLARRALVEHAIATLIGRPASDFSIPRAIVTIASPHGPVAAPSSLLERRPDIAASERQVASANEQIGVARADFYPRFFLNLSGGTQDRGVHLLDLKNELFTIGPSVTFPILDGGRRAATLAAALAHRDQAVALYRANVLQAVQEVEDALATNRYLGQEGQRLRNAVAAEQKVLGLSLTLYRDGATTYLDVVTAQTTLLQQQVAEIVLLTRRLNANVDLFVALGGGWDAPVRVAERTP